MIGDLDDPDIDMELMRREAKFWKAQHQKLVETLREIPGYIGVPVLPGVVYGHSGGQHPSPVEMRQVHVALSKKKEQHGGE